MRHAFSPPTLSPADLADRLGLVRQMIRDLKAEEACLRRALFSLNQDGPVRGRHFQAIAQITTARRFCKALLPPEIHDDTRYWKRSNTKILRVKPVEPAPAATQDRIRPSPGIAAKRPPHRRNAPNPDDDIQLIEPW